MSLIITLEQAQHLIGKGGWRLRGGHAARNAIPSAEVNAAAVVDNVLLLSNGSKEVVRVNLDRAFIQEIGEGCPYQITFHGPIKIKEQIRKVDGGGWRTVEQTGLLLKIVHTASEAAFIAEQKEKQRLAELARQAQREETRRLEAEAHERHLAAYVTRQKNRLQGAQFEDICIHDDSVTVTFSGGLQVTVQLHDREDTYDPNEMASLDITVGDEHL
jgi:hypothetical protein